MDIQPSERYSLSKSVLEECAKPLFNATPSLSECEKVFKELTDELYADALGLAPKSKCERVFKELTDELYADALGLAPKSKCERVFKELTDKLYTESFPAKETAKKLLNKSKWVSLKSLSRKSQDPNESLMNETSRYLSSSRASRWEDWQKKLISYTLRKNLAGYCKDPDTRLENAKDLVRSFLVWVCAKDMFKGRTHEPIHYHWVQKEMFTQWVIRYHEKQGQCALSRTLNKKSRTQQEGKVGEFTNVASTTPCSEAVKKSEATGQVESIELWDSHQLNEAEEAMEEQAIHERVYRVLNAKATSEKQADLWRRTWLVVYALKDPSRKMYRTDQEWADDWGLPVGKVRRLKDRVRAIVRESMSS